MGAVTTAPINIFVGKESMMKSDIFRQPVSILVGLGFPAEIRSVPEGLLCAGR